MKPTSQANGKTEKVLFMHVPIGALIEFNGCECVKLDEEHVKFLKNADGTLIDYTQTYNARYARTTQQHIGGTPVRIIKQLPTEKLNSLPIAGLRKYFAKIIRNQRAAIRSFHVRSNVELIRKEKMEAKLEQTRFLAKDLNFFCQNPKTLI